MRNLELATDATAVAEVAEAAEVVGSSAAQGLPSTRAGGQDDVSYNKLPQIRTGRLQCRYDTSVINTINLFKIGAVA